MSRSNRRVDTAGFRIPGWNPLLLVALFWGLLATSVAAAQSSRTNGVFDLSRDLLLAHFDCKTDVDDLHSVAGVATILADPRLDGLRFRAVAGAYGTQGGLYVPAPGLFTMAFGDRWSDAHSNRATALEEVSRLAEEVLIGGGDIWIAEAGQSDFTADTLRRLRRRLPSIDTSSRVHVVQHSEWNEKSAEPENLAFVRLYSNYRKIPDGNAAGNGSPGFRSDGRPDWQEMTGDDRVAGIWQRAVALADEFNGREGRYNNETIAKGGLDFSDVVETAWILGFEHLADVDAFFAEFGSGR